MTLAAHMRLSNKMTWRQKFERVEQVIEVVSVYIQCTHKYNLIVYK